MASQTLTTLDGILKELYRGPIVELLNQETFLIDQLEKTNAQDIGKFTGREVVIPLHVGRNRGRGALTDGGQLPGAGGQSYLTATVKPRYLSQPIELTDMVIKQSQSDEGAFIRGLESEMSGGMQDLRKDVCRMAYGTGDGLLATITTGATSATQAIDTGQFIAVGDPVDVLKKSDGTVRGSALTVQSVTYTGTANSSTQTAANVVLSSSVTTTTSTDGIYISGDRSNEIDGLGNIASTGRTLHGINSSTYPIWDSNVISAGQANPSEDLFMQLAQRIRLRAGQNGTNIDWFLTSLGVQRRLALTYQSQKRWSNAEVLDIEGGYSAIMVAAGNKPVPVVSDVDAPAGKAWAVSKDGLAWMELQPPDWLEAPTGGGGILHLKDAGTAGAKLAIWQAFIVWYADLVALKPLRQGAITGFNDDVPLARV